MRQVATFFGTILLLFLFASQSAYGHREWHTVAPMSVNAPPLLTDTIARDTVVGWCSPFIDPSGMEYHYASQGEWSVIQFYESLGDSLVIDYTAELFLLEPQVAYDETWFCPSYYYAPLDSTITGNAEFESTYIDQYECPSPVIVFITLAPAYVSISQEGDSLVAIGAGGFQWIDCETGLEIEEATGSVFIPEQSGQYTVSASSFAGTSTADCVSVVVSSLVESKRTNTMQLFPNPMTNTTTIEIPDLKGEVTVEIFSITGEQLRQEEITAAGSILLERRDLVAGQYVLRVSQKTDTWERSFIVIDK